MAEKTVFIPARLKSSVVGGHVTGTADIIDDARNKTQEDINSEVSSDSADIHAHINTIESKIPLEASPSNKLVDAGSLAAETERAKAAERANASAIQAEENRAIGAENALQESIAGEVIRATAAENTHTEGIAAINAKISSAASPENQLADKAFVNSSVATATAEFRGTSASGLTEEEFFAWANSLTKDVNDYVYWNTQDSTGNIQFRRYKYDGTSWLYEYTLNNSSFTSDQWAAINSGLSSSHKVKLDALPESSELTSALEGKQAVISDLDTIRSGAASGATAYQKSASGIPLEDLSLGVQESLSKADTALQSHQSLDDYYVKSEVNTLLDNKADADSVFTKTEIEGKLSGKQDTLASSVNIKTINGYTLLGSGDLPINSTGVASDTDPLMDGEASAGASLEYARGDHRHPSDDTKQDVLDFATISEAIAAANELT